MSNQMSRVIKNGDVLLAGRQPVGRAAQCASTSPSQSAARIVAEDALGATLEVVCSCGKRSYVRCAYRRMPSQPAPAARQATVPENQENQL